MNIQVLQQDRQSERESPKEREQKEEREEDLSDDERIKRQIYRVEKLHNEICREPITKVERYNAFNLNLYTLSFDSLAEN